MISFPLKIEVFRLSNGLWRAHTLSSEYEVKADAQTREHALGALFYAMKDTPGFHLWTFNISSQEEDGTRVELAPGEPPPAMSSYEAELYVISGKINAIKAYRERTRLGLREAKEAIERDAKAQDLKCAKLTSLDERFGSQY